MKIYSIDQHLYFEEKLNVGVPSTGVYCFHLLCLQLEMRRPSRTNFKFILFVYLFICSLFNNIDSDSGCITANDRMVVNSEFERMQKEAGMA
jgi:hypothetical protein